MHSGWSPLPINTQTQHIPEENSRSATVQLCSHHQLSHQTRLLLLKAYLVGEQATALVPMLGTQSPLAQHVISGDLNRLGEPAVEQRVVQWEGL